MKRTAALPTAAFVLGLTLTLVVAAPPALAQASVWTGSVAEFPHDNFGVPARVVATRHDRRLGATIVKFSTGARLIVKPTHFTPGQVSVVASFGSGRSGAPADLVHALWATTLFPIGGTGHLSYNELDAWQQSSGNPVNVTLVPGVSAFRLQGEVPSNDLNAELTLLTVYAREPGFRDDMVAKIVSVGAMMARQIEGDPSARFTRAVQRRLVGRRYQELPEQADLVATSGTEMQSLLGPAFAMAADIAIIGDIGVDVAVRAVATTLAAGEPRPAPRRGIVAEAWPTTRPRQQTAIVNASATTDRLRGFYWRLPDIRTEPRIEWTARVAAAMIEERLVKSAKPASAGALPLVARAVVPADLKGGGYLGVVVNGGAMSLARTHALLADMARDLTAGRFKAEELSHAQRIVAAEIGAEWESNAWWAQRLCVALRDPAMAQALRIEAEGGLVDQAQLVGFIRRTISGMAPIVVVADAGNPQAASMFGDYHIFEIEDGRWARPASIYIDSPFAETGLSAYYRYKPKNGPYALASRYGESKMSKERFAKFAHAVGTISQPTIRKSNCSKNPQWDHLRGVGGERSTSPIDRDYFFEGFSEATKEPDIRVSRLLWATVDPASFSSTYFHATFQRNRSYGSRTAPSRLAVQLKSTTWVPQTDGSFVKPADARPELLPPGFPYDQGKAWLKAIGFGEAAARQSAAAQARKSMAATLGFKDDAAFDDAKKFAEIDPEERKRFFEERDRQTSFALPENEPKNPDRRALKVSAQAADAPGKFSEKRTRSVSVGIGAVKQEAEQYLRQQYTNPDGDMICQICSEPLPFRLPDGRHYVEKVEFFEDAEKRHFQNYLALCPNHAAMYQHALGSSDVIREMFLVCDDGNLEIVLAGKDASIYFTMTHLADLKSIMGPDADPCVS